MRTKGYTKRVNMTNEYDAYDGRVRPTTLTPHDEWDVNKESVRRFRHRASPAAETPVRAYWGTGTATVELVSVLAALSGPIEPKV